MKLTKRAVDALQPNGARYFVWDEAASGFGIRVEASGHKTFVCRYRANGIRRQYTIGRYGIITAEEARAEAHRVLRSATLGEDLSAARQEEREAIRISELVD